MSVYDEINKRGLYDSLRETTGRRPGDGGSVVLAHRHIRAVERERVRARERASEGEKDLFCSTLLIYGPRKEIFYLLPFISFIPSLPPGFTSINRSSRPLFLIYWRNTVTMEQDEGRESE